MQVAEERLRFQKLHEDFLYNLQLLDERDAELRRDADVISHLESVIRDRYSLGRCVVAIRMGLAQSNRVFAWGLGTVVAIAC